MGRRPASVRLSVCPSVRLSVCQHAHKRRREELRSPFLVCRLLTSIRRGDFLAQLIELQLKAEMLSSICVRLSVRLFVYRPQIKTV